MFLRIGLYFGLWSLPEELRSEVGTQFLRKILDFDAKMMEIMIISVVFLDRGNEVFQHQTLHPLFLSNVWDSSTNLCALIGMGCIMTPYSSSNSIADFHEFEVSKKT